MALTSPLPYPPEVLCRHSKLTIALSLLAIACPAHAELIASEDFDYASTLTTGANGGKGWANAWSGVSFITAGSLTLPGLASTGHKLTVSGSQSGADSVKCSFRDLATSGHDGLLDGGKFGRDGTTLWISFLVNCPTGRSTGFAGLSLFDGPQQDLFLGDTGASNVWAFERSRQLQRFSDVEANDAVCFLVYRIRFQPGDEQIDMWVNPKPGRLQPADAEAAASEASVRDFRFTRLRLCAAPVPISFDALRIGTTYADVASASQMFPTRWLVIAQLTVLILAGALLILFWKLKRGGAPCASTMKAT